MKTSCFRVEIECWICTCCSVSRGLNINSNFEDSKKVLGSGFHVENGNCCSKKWKKGRQDDLKIKSYFSESNVLHCAFQRRRGTCTLKSPTLQGRGLTRFEFVLYGYLSEGMLKSKHYQCVGMEFT